MNYPPRAVQGFFKKSELELRIQRRGTRKPLASAEINPAIVERFYLVRDGSGSRQAGAGRIPVGFKEKFPEGSEGSKAFAVVTAAVAEVDAFSTTKLTAKRVSVTSKLAARLTVSTHIAAIARPARVLAKATPGADEKFPLPTRKGDIAVLQPGRLFLQEAASVKDSLIRCGLPPTFLEDLQQAVAGFERAIGVRSAGRAGAGVSRKGIHASVKIGVDAVGSLDALVLNVLGHDGMAMNRWKRDRHVDMTGKTASAGIPPDTPPDHPASSTEQPAPVPQPTGESTPASSAASSPETDSGAEPLRRAS